MKTKIFVVSWEVFPYDTLVCLGSKKEEILKWIDRTGHKLSEGEIEAITMRGMGRTIILKGNQTILWLKNYPKPGSGTLAHEIFHAVEMITDRMGIRLSQDSDEIFAYMIQFLTNKIISKLTKQRGEL